MPAMLLPPLPPVIAGWSAYSGFYILGFGVAGMLLLWAGYRRGYPLRPWLLLVAGTVLSLIVGTRLISGNIADYQALLSHGHWGSSEPLGRSVLGGIIGAGLALAGLRRLLGFGRDAADAFALPFIVGLAVQGVGCLLTGCCFGEVLGEGWGLATTYGPGTAPFEAQVLRGMVPATAAHSLPVHAAPLYQIGLCLGIALLLLFGRKAVARYSGVAVPLVFCLYAAGRFGLEFLRDPLGDVVGGGLWLGLKPVQWGLLLGTAVLLAVVARRVSKPSEVIATAQPVDQPLLNLLIVSLLLAVPSLLPGHFDLGETLVVRALLVPVLVLEAKRLLQALHLSRPVPLALLLLSVGLMSQTPADSTARHGTTPPCTVAFGLGGLTGSSYQLYYPPNVGCGSNIQKNIKDFEGYKQRFTGATASASYEVPLKAPGRTVLRVGLNGFLGQTSFAPLVLNVSAASGGDSILVLQQASRRLLYDFNPNVEFFKKGSPGHSLHLRLGFGLHLSHCAAYDFVTEPLRNRKIVPSAVMEIGYRNIFWTHTSLYQRWDAVGNGTARLGFGTGFGLDNLTVLGGWAYSNSNGQLSNNYGFLGQPPFKAPTSAFVDVQWQISPTWGVEASSLSNFNDVTQSSLGVRYQLPLLKK